MRVLLGLAPYPVIDPSKYAGRGAPGHQEGRAFIEHFAPVLFDAKRWDRMGATRPTKEVENAAADIVICACTGSVVGGWKVKVDGVDTTTTHVTWHMEHRRSPLET